MFKKIAAVVGTIFAALLFGSTPALANILTQADVTMTCSSYSLTLTATDMNAGQNYSISYAIQASPTATGFPIFQTVPFTYTGAQGGSYTTTVTGTFPTLTGDHTFSGQAQLIGYNSINLNFVNGTGQLNCGSSPPSIECFSLNSTGTVGVPYNSGTPTVIGGVAPFTYSIILGTLPAGLTLNPATGAVTGTPTAPGTFSIRVTDSTGQASPGSCPIIINPAQLVLSCAGMNSTGTVGVFFNSGLPTVTGGTAPFTFSIVGTLPAGLSINPTNGDVSGTPTAPGTFSIKVTDSTGQTATQLCSITINPAQLELSCAGLTTTGTVGVFFNSGLPTVTGGVGPYTFSIVGTLPAGLSINTTNGDVSGTPTAAGTFSIKVTDSTGQSAQQVCPITINPAQLVLSCAGLTTTGTVGVFFNSGLPTVTGGTAPYTFSIVGTLPAGLTINTTNGDVSGTPTAAGTFSIKVTDSTGQSATQLCPIIINPAQLVLSCVGMNSSGTVGVPFNSGAPTVTGGTAPYTFSIVGTLPAGLTLNVTTGVVSGTPTATGSFNIKVTDSTGQSATQMCPITINPAQLVLSCVGVTSTGTVGVPFNSGAPTVTGGVAPYTFSIGSGTFPSGLTLNVTTGVVSGTPTATGSFTIKVTDSTGQSATQMCPITINPAQLELSCAGVTSTGTVGVFFNSGAPIATGGVAPYTFSIVGTLPAGLTLNVTTGVVSGTPTATGSFNIKVTDSTGQSATQMCPITINPAQLELSCVGVATTGTVGVPFNSGAPTATGGVAPYTFSIVGTLPAGLTLNVTTGVVSGTPTATGSFNIKVTDSTGQSATQMCPITINPAQLVLSCVGVATSGTVGVPFNSGAPTATGGVAPYTFSIVGTLPAGLTLNVTTGVVSGTPTATGSFNIKVTDSTGQSATQMCPITINPAQLELSCAGVTSTGTVGVFFNSGAPTATGGVAPYTFSIVGTLPAGLTVNTSTGVVSGTPTATGSFNIKVTDSTGASATQMCPITINPAQLVLSCSGLNSTGTVGVPFNSGTPIVTGGVAPYTFSILGTLPAGLTLNTSTGAVTGTPTASGTFNIQVTDSTGQSATQMCPITINPAQLVLSCAGLTSTGSVGVAFNSGAPTVTGGVAPYTFSIVGTLPAGLTINPGTGVVSGTPTAPGSFNIKVTDSTGASATQTCPISIIGQNLIIKKTASPTTVDPFKLVTFTYVVTNGGGTTLTNIVVTDDNGTPNDPSDDHVVGTIASLAPGASVTLTWTTYPPVKLIVVDKTLGFIPGGSMTVQNVETGGCTPNVNCNLKFMFNQSLGLNDNSYGTTASAGWGKNGHKFNDLVGSDQAEWTFMDGAGNTVLDFSEDYISQASVPDAGCPNPNFTSYGSGYGTLGYCGGDGKFISGDKTKIVGEDTTITDDLNQSAAFYGFTTNSPAQGTPGWNFVDGYSVTVNPALFGANGFGDVEIPNVHNSPSMNGTDQVCEIPIGGNSTNTATAVASNGLTASAQATVTVNPGKSNCKGTPPPPPVLSCSSLNSTGTVGVAFNSGAPSVTGGTTPYTFSIIGALPAGLSFNTSTGVVSGTPTASGSFSIGVTDALGEAAAGSCPITISPTNSPVLSCSSLKSTGTVDVAFDSGVPTVTGGTPSFTFALANGTLPSGLSLNSSTGEVTGTPTATGSFSIKATDSTGLSTANSCPITIVPTCLLSQLGAAGNFSILGLQGANIQMSSGGLQVNGNEGIGQNGQVNMTGGGTVTGALYADPTAKVQTSGGSTFAGGTITMPMSSIQSAVMAEANSLGSLAATQSFGSITSPTVISGNGGQNVIHINGQVNLNGGQKLTLSGGPTDTFVIDVSDGFSLTGGSAVALNGVSPSSVLFYFPSTGGAVQTTGNSSTAGIFLAPQRTIDISGGVHQSEFISGMAMTFHSAPVINALPPCTPGQIALSCPVSTGVVGTPYNSALTVTGGQSPFVFSLTSGALPGGLSLTTNTGAISGTPTAAGPFTFTAKVQDSTGQAAGTATANCSITTSPTNNACTLAPGTTDLGPTSWNKFTAQGANDVVWIHMHIGTPSGVPTNQVTTVQFTGVSFLLNGQTYALPDGFLIFDPSAPSTPTTTYNSTFAPHGSWTTTLNPSSLSDEIFFDGQAVPVDSNLTSGGQATITYTTLSSDDNLAFSWQWSAAVYTFWPGNNQAQILPTHSGDHAGAPQNTQVQQSLIQGPRGGGGSNFTGSWSATGHGSCPTQNTSHIVGLSH